MWFIVFNVIGAVCAILAFALVIMVDAHGHGMTYGDRNALYFLASLSVIFFFIALCYLKSMLK